MAAWQLACHNHGNYCKFYVRWNQALARLTKCDMHTSGKLALVSFFVFSFVKTLIFQKSRSGDEALLDCGKTHFLCPTLKRVHTCFIRKRYMVVRMWIKSRKTNSRAVCLYFKNSTIGVCCLGM